MSASCSRCPTCNRALRPKRVETPEEAFQRIATKARTGVNASLRKPMPPKTVYRE